MVAAIIQARTGSVRFPYKILHKIGCYTLLEHIIIRLKKSKVIDKIILATTDSDADLILKSYADKYHIQFFQGSEENVLERFYQASQQYSVNDIIRICADSPFIDWQQIDLMYYDYKQQKADLLTVDPLVSRLLDGIEIISYSLLDLIYKQATLQHHKEHVTLFVKENINFGKVVYYSPEKKLQRLEYRITIDYPEDLVFCQNIFNQLIDRYPDTLFPITEILTLES